MESMAVRTIIILACLNALILQTPAQDWIGPAERLSFQGGLILAVAMLWRALSAKDSLIVASVKSMTEALQQSASTQAELRAIITEFGGANRQLAEQIALLRVAIGELPCTAPDGGVSAPPPRRGATRAAGA